MDAYEVLNCLASHDGGVASSRKLLAWLLEDYEYITLADVERELDYLASLGRVRCEYRESLPGSGVAVRMAFYSTEWFGEERAAK